MRKAFLLFLVMLGAACTVWSQQPTAAAPQKDTVVQDGVTLVVGEDYSWDGQVKAKGLAWHTPEFDAARARCIAFEAAVKAAQKANKDGDYAGAEAKAPEYVMKAFYGLNRLRQLMGGKRSAGSWGGYSLQPGEDPESPIYGGPNAAAVKAQFLKVQGWVAKAIAGGKPADSQGNTVATVDEYLKGYASGILSEVLR